MVAIEERKRGREEEEDICFAMRIIHVLYMLVKHVMDIQALLLQGEWEKFAISRLV